ncbi:MAG: hypothetical protein JWP59_3755 [Massilia sp.]|nr:hypothetical protein [Massilia sp.]
MTEQQINIGELTKSLQQIAACPREEQAKIGEMAAALIADVFGKTDATPIPVSRMDVLQQKIRTMEKELVTREAAAPNLSGIPWIQNQTAINKLCDDLCDAHLEEHEATRGKNWPGSRFTMHERIS